MNIFQKSFKGALLASCAMVSPNLVMAQETTAQQADPDNVDTVIAVGRYIPDEKRSTSEISNVLTATDLTYAGDSDVAVALTRLPGITPDSSGKYVVVRGLSERYTSTLLNGMELPSPDPLKRAVPLDIFPTSLVSGVLVQKTYSAEYPGAFGGGVVDIRTIAVPDDTFFEMGFDAGFNTESTFKDGLQYDGSDTDWLGFDDGKRELPAAIAANPTLEGMSPEELEAAGEAFPNLWSIDNQKLAADFGFSAAGGSSVFIGDESELGFVAAIDYGSQMRNLFGQRTTYQASGATDSGLEPDRDMSPDACIANGVDASDCGYRLTTWDIDLNAFAAAGLKINADHSIKYTSLLLRSSQQQVEIQQGTTNSEDMANFTRLDWKERQVWSHALDGEHAFDFNFDEMTELSWFVNYTEASRDVPLRRRFNYIYDISREVWQLNARSIGNRTEFGMMNDESLDMGFRVKQPLYINGYSFDLKFGGSYNEKTRSSDYLKYHFDVGPVTNYELLTYVPEIVFGPTNIDPNGIFLREVFDASNAFNADFENKQFFTQFDYQINDEVRVSGGVRFEDSLQTVLTNDRTTNVPIAVNQEKQSWLPSATVTWEFEENMQVRLGYSETLNRPDSRELAPVFFVREDGRTEKGNSDLEIATVRNFDARFEWYFNDGESFTLGAFYKEIDNPIEYSILARGDGEADTIANAEKAKLKGVEIELEKTLGEWEDREFFLKVNGSYIDSEVTRSAAKFGDVTNLVGRLQGQSDYVANAQIGFENLVNGERFNIILNYQGDRIYRLGTFSRPDLVEEMPFELNMLYTRDFELASGAIITGTLKAKNLLNETPVRKQGTEIAQQYVAGRSFSIGFKYAF
ncbi:TonB-dependent receptor domain-containing protein [Pseudemcibacter aquimaris]|uniref:TonB-dependent receptor domain-containing protein n=1 Tax=Pseudemcibacter aquimaris TaxID=2857064 RepID=UPI00201183CF|nr:TonB-dependent receptor [Pseudemcibacter aquimaris]MCC3861764.1 TonB-dependent receptor [Pseudemcibacter aquimaris]WDU58530.1 TonB-dependent receptor [Pseudemcibacter aquimaris]